METVNIIPSVPEDKWHSGREKPGHNRDIIVKDDLGNTWLTNLEEAIKMHQEGWEEYRKCELVAKWIYTKDLWGMEEPIKKESYRRYSDSNSSYYRNTKYHSGFIEGAEWMMSCLSEKAECINSLKETKLYTSARENVLEILRVLCFLGFDPEFKDYENRNPFLFMMSIDGKGNIKYYKDIKKFQDSPYREITKDDILEIKRKFL